MVDFEQQRLTMVKSQLRPNEVTDRRLLAAMRTLPRERFVPARLSLLAYMDESVEVFPAIDGAPARFLLSPMVLGGSFSSPRSSRTIMSSISAAPPATRPPCWRILPAPSSGLNPSRNLPRPPRAISATWRSRMWRSSEALWTKGYPQGGPYDAILLNGSVQEIPEAFFGQLRDGGRVVAVVTSGVATARPRQGLSVRESRRRGERVCRISTRGRGRLPGFSRAQAFAF